MLIRTKKQKNVRGEDEKQELQVSSLAKGQTFRVSGFSASRRLTEPGVVLAVSVTDLKRARSEFSAHSVQTCSLQKIRAG